MLPVLPHENGLVLSIMQGVYIAARKARLGGLWPWLLDAYDVVYDNGGSGGEPAAVGADGLVDFKFEDDSAVGDDAKASDDDEGGDGGGDGSGGGGGSSMRRPSAQRRRRRR